MKPPAHEPRDLRDPTDTWWTIDQAAAHFGVRRATILQWIRDGLPSHGKGKMLRRPEVLSAYQQRAKRQRESRFTNGAPK